MSKYEVFTINYEFHRRLRRDSWLRQPLQNLLTEEKNKSKGGIYYGNHRKAKKQKFRGKKRRAVKCH